MVSTEMLNELLLLGVMFGVMLIMLYFVGTYFRKLAYKDIEYADKNFLIQLEKIKRIQEKDR